MTANGQDLSLIWIEAVHQFLEIFHRPNRTLVYLFNHISLLQLAVVRICFGDDNAANIARQIELLRERRG